MSGGAGTVALNAPSAAGSQSTARYSATLASRLAQKNAARLCAYGYAPGPASAPAPAAAALCRRRSARIARAASVEKSSPCSRRPCRSGVLACHHPQHPLSQRLCRSGEGQDAVDGVRDLVELRAWDAGVERLAVGEGHGRVSVAVDDADQHP